jgi:pimeloyl-ACP methyl ester carboxylesterase
MNTPCGLAYFEIEAGSEGSLVDLNQPGFITAFLSIPPVKHLFVIAHGWNSTAAVARDLYQRFFTEFCETLAGHSAASVTPGQCAVVGVIWPSEQFTAEILEPLNLATYYRMKNRAGLVGRLAVAATLDQVRRATPSIRIHLVGHSFGCRVISAAALAAAEPVDSMTLLQAAFSQNSFSPDYDASHQAGYFRPVVTDHKCRGPMMVTHSVHDHAVGVAYSIASRIARQNGSGLESIVDPYAGLGHNGARHTPEATDGDLLPAGSAYKLRSGGIFNLNADGVIFAHDDVVKPETVWALLAASGIGRGD